MKVGEFIEKINQLQKHPNYKPNSTIEFFCNREFIWDNIDVVVIDKEGNVTFSDEDIPPEFIKDCDIV